MEYFPWYITWLHLPLVPTWLQKWRVYSSEWVCQPQNQKVVGEVAFHEPNRGIIGSTHTSVSLCDKSVKRCNSSLFLSWQPKEAIKKNWIIHNWLITNVRGMLGHVGSVRQALEVREQSFLCHRGRQKGSYWTLNGAQRPTAQSAPCST